MDSELHPVPCSTFERNGGLKKQSVVLGAAEAAVMVARFGDLEKRTKIVASERAGVSAALGTAQVVRALVLDPHDLRDRKICDGQNFALH